MCPRIEIPLSLLATHFSISLQCLQEEAKEITMQMLKGIWVVLTVFFCKRQDIWEVRISRR